MKLSAADMLNFVIGILTIGTTLAGMINTPFSIMIGVLIISWLAYYRIPWAHKGWKDNVFKESAMPFYSFSRILHSAIIYSLIVLIASSLAVGLITKAGPSLLANDTAEYVWNNETWPTKGISSSTIPQELAASKKNQQPFAVIVNNGLLKATPLQESLGAIAENYGNAFVQFAAVAFLFALTAAIGLYPMEIIANLRIENPE